MSDGRPTMRDVAARAGVSLKTVSRVVNGAGAVSPALADSVQRSISALGYRRDDTARGLRRGRSLAVGLVVDDLCIPFFAAIAGAVEEALRVHGRVLFAAAAPDAQAERAAALALCSRRVDGLILAPRSAEQSYLAGEMQAGTAVVFVDRPPSGVGADCVLADNVEASRSAVEHLLAHGHRRVAFLGDAPAIHTARERRHGYEQALRGAGVDVDPALVAMAPLDGRAHAAAFEGMLALPQPPTAVFCGCAPVTVALLQWSARRGDVPAPAVVGFDDFELAAALSPGVTVVAQDPSAMGRQAAALLLERMAGERCAARRVVVPTRLVQRGSGEIAGPFARG